MNKNCLIGAILIVGVFLQSCSPAAHAPTPTPTLNPTETPMPTATLQPTPTIERITLGSPFAPDCGDGIPRIWSNDSFNGPWKNDAIDEHHGHVDIFVSEGCDPRSLEGELLAPVPGYIIHEGGDVYRLFLPPDKYISGTERALIFAGVEDPDLSKASDIHLNLGHISSIEGDVIKGQSIGEVVGYSVGDYHPKIAYKVYITYDGTVYDLSPTLFEWDVPLICHPNSWYDCEPEPHDYAP